MNGVNLTAVGHDGKRVRAYYSNEETIWFNVVDEAPFLDSEIVEEWEVTKVRIIDPTQWGVKVTVTGYLDEGRNFKLEFSTTLDGF